MKREHLVKPIPSCPDDFSKSSPKPMVKAQAEPQAPHLEGQRRVKTSAAMIGLALSMSATGMLLPQRDSQAFAAESAQNERTVSLPPLTLEQPGQEQEADSSAGTPSQPVASASVAAPAPPVIKHEIAQGDTLWELAEDYRVETGALATSNNISPDTPLPVGKALKIPVTPEPAAPSGEPAAAMIQVPAPEPAPQVAAREVPTVAVEATEEASGTVAEQAPVVIPVSTPEPLPSIQASAVPSVSVAASPETLEVAPEESPVPTLAASPATVEEATEVQVQTIPTDPPQPSVAASPRATVQEETNSDEAAVVIPVFTPEDKADEQSEVVIPSYKFVEPEVAIEAEVAVEANNRPVQTTAADALEFSAQPTYQVQPGDTLDAIARRYGISRTELVEANRLSNPNLIKVDQQLRIPTPETVTETAQATPSPVSQPQIMAENPTSIRIDAQIETPTERSLEQLQADIEELQRNYSPEAEPAVASESEAIELQVTPAVTENASNPEWEAAQNEVPLEVENFQPAPRPAPTARRTPSPGEQSQPQNLLAAAPISVEAYNPMLQTPVGEMVAPDVPQLAPPEEYLPDSPQRFDGYIWPAKGVLTSGYGWRWGRMHKGVDIAAPIGTPIVAAADGEVISAGWNSGGFGNLVKVKHYDGSITLYAHNNRILVRRGQKVDQGQQIAEMGSTGYSTGPHLHFEVHPQGGSAQNPMAFLPKR